MMRKAKTVPTNPVVARRTGRSTAGSKPMSPAASLASHSSTASRIAGGSSRPR